MEHKNPYDQLLPQQPRPRYEPPRVVAYHEDELLDMIGPAVACARWPTSSPPARGPAYEPGEYEDF